MKNVYKALGQFQKEFNGVEKKRKNPFTKSLYASLDDVMNAAKPILDNCGLLLIQPLEYDNGEQFLCTKLVHIESGEVMESRMLLKQVIEKAGAQGLGSAMTYGRRYAACSMLNIVETGDDDGNAVEVQPEQRVDQNQLSKIYDLIEATGTNDDAVLAHCKKAFKVNNIDNLSYGQAQTIISMLKRKHEDAKNK